MSAFGYKRTSNPYLANVRFTPEADIRIAIPYQPLTNVCFTPNSGRSTGYRRMSAYDPKRTLGTRHEHQFLPCPT